MSTDRELPDASDEELIVFYHAAAAGSGMKAYLASLLNERGALRGCGCPTCDGIRTDALAWRRHVAAAPFDTGAGTGPEKC